MSRASIDRLYEVLETTPDIVDGNSDKTVGSGSIEFKTSIFRILTTKKI